METEIDIKFAFILFVDVRIYLYDLHIIYLSLGSIQPNLPPCDLQLCTLHLE